MTNSKSSGINIYVYNWKVNSQVLWDNGAHGFHWDEVSVVWKSRGVGM